MFWQQVAVTRAGRARRAASSSDRPDSMVTILRTASGGPGFIVAWCCTAAGRLCN